MALTTVWWLRFLPVEWRLLPGGYVGSEDRALRPESLVSPEVPATNLKNPGFARAPNIAGTSTSLVCTLEIKVLKFHGQVQVSL